MKRTLSGTIAIAALLGCMSIYADDLTANKNYKGYKDYVPTGYDWTGFYGGIGAGESWTRVSNSLRIVNNSPNYYFFPPSIPGVNASGSGNLNKNHIFESIQLGYNLLSFKTLFGLEAAFNNLNSSNNKGGTFSYTTNGAPYRLNTSTTTNWLFSLRPRIGLPVNNALFYLTGGLAVAQYKFKQSFSESPFTPTPENASFTRTQPGWTIGAGIEYAFAPRWSVKGEYLFNRFGKESVSGHLNNANGASPTPGFVDGATFNNTLSQRDVHMLGAGINYHLA